VSQEEPEDYPYPLTLKPKMKSAEGSGTTTPTLVNGPNGLNGVPLASVESVPESADAEL